MPFPRRDCAEILRFRVYKSMKDPASWKLSSTKPAELTAGFLGILWVHIFCLHYPRDPSIQIIPTLGPKVYKQHVHWAIWVLRLIMVLC